ncbi:MAG: phage holin family protein [Clostridiaceae bacterium]|nr:phage holin family protein [Clostridiaceae bacterium]
MVKIMENVLILVKLTGAGIVSAFAHVFGGMDMILGLLLWLITIDYITGVLNAIVQKRLNSEVGAKGIAKKVGMLSVVAISNLISQYAGMDIRTFVIGYYIANESISILENAGKMGAPIPKRLMDILQQLSKDDDDGNQ